MNQAIPVHTLDQLLAVCRFMDEFGGPWWVASGWAVDVWVGRPSREHEDIEIGVLHEHQAALLSWLEDWDFYTPVNDRWVLKLEDERLVFPQAMLQVRRTSETFVLDAGMPSEFEFILNDAADGDWVFGPDPSIRLPLESVYVPSPLGIPVVQPEILLLNKSRSHRPKDDHDFGLLSDRLSAEQREWLRIHLARLQPNDAWLPSLRCSRFATS